MKISHLLAAPLVLAAVVAGCGGSEGGGGGGGGDGGLATADAGTLGADAGTPAADAGTSAPDAGQKTFTINISNFTYSPADLTVPPGATVTVVNMDPTAHSVTSESAVGQFTKGSVNGVSFDTGPIPAGGTSSFTIPASAPNGTVVPYFCTVHVQAMTNTGQITVDTSASP